MKAIETNVADYFSPAGEYLGPDEHGIAPIFEPVITSASLKAKGGV